MPFINVKLVDGVFSSEQKHSMAAALTDVMVQFEGSEAFREVVTTRRDGESLRPAPGACSCDRPAAPSQRTRTP